MALSESKREICREWVKEMIREEGVYGCVYGHGFCVDREERGRGEPQGSPSAEAGRPFRGGLSGANL